MPKKLNFLGGQQNYDPNTGEYMPDLKGPNGESPKQFKSFGKDKDESFDATNKKRMGKPSIDYEEKKKPQVQPKNIDLPIDETNTISDDGNYSLKEWFDKNSHQLQGEQENKDMVVDEMVSKFSGISKEQAEKYYDAKKNIEEGDNKGLDLTDEFQDRLQDLSNDFNTSGLDEDEYIEELKKIKADLESKKDQLTEEQYKSLTEEIDRGIKGPEGEEPKGSTQYFKHPEVDGVWHDTGKTIEKGGNSYKVYENEQGKTWAVSDRFSKQFQPFNKDKKTELLSKEYLDKFYELSGGDEDKMLELIRKDPAYQNNDSDPSDTWSMGDLEGVVGAYFEKRSSQNKTESFDQINAKRTGKEQPKSEEPNTNSMSIKEFSSYAKKMLKDKGFDTKGISVRGRYAGYSDALDVVVKDPNIDVAEIRKLLQKHESYERDASGEILQGGNRYIHVQYDYNAFDKVKQEGKADAENLMKQADTSRGSGIEISKGVYLFKEGNRYFINGDYEKVGGSRTVYSPEDLAVMKWKLKKFGRLN